MDRARAKTGLSERQLFEAVHARMRTLAGPASSDFQDLVQIAAEKVFGSLDRFDGRGQLGSWIYGVCYHVLLNHRRFHRRLLLRFSYSLTLEESPSEVWTPPELLEARRRAQQVHRALDTLSEKYRAVVVLHDIEELSVSEIAGIVGAGELTVRSRLRDGRKKLAELMRASGAKEIGGAHEPEPSR